MSRVEIVLLVSSAGAILVAAGIGLYVWATMLGDIVSGACLQEEEEGDK